MKQSEIIQKWASDNGLTITSIFVPFSVSRNRNEKHKSLNYLVSIKSKTYTLTTDYTKGSGHIKIISKKNNCAHYSAINRDINILKNKACEIGNYPNEVLQGYSYQVERQNGKSLPFPIPTIDEVLYSLQCDSDVSNYSCFAEWADTYGYDSDSISAKNIYEACQNIASQFNKILTTKQREELSKLLQDY